MSIWWRNGGAKVACWLAAALICLLAACDEAPMPGFRNPAIGDAGFGRDFALFDHTGQARRLADYRGKVVVIFFGYTQCPDICPTTLSIMAETMRLLGADAARVQVLFVTLDPARDTVDLLARYVPQFHPSFVALRGDAAATEAVAREYRVFHQQRPGAAPNAYSIDHSTHSYLHDPQGRLRLYASFGGNPDDLVADIRLLLAGR